MRAAALLGGTTTALLMGLLVLSLTPERTIGPTVAGSIPIQDPGDTDPGDAASVSPAPPVTRPGDPGRAAAPPVAPAADRPPLATVVGLDGTAVAPSGAVLDRMRAASNPAPSISRSGLIVERISRHRPTVGPLTPQIEVVLADGSSAIAQVLDPGDGSGLAVIRVPNEATGSTAHHSAPAPTADEIVLVLAPDTTPMTMAELLSTLPTDGAVSPSELPYPDGSPVVDRDGHLIGVLACSGEGMELVPITSVVRLVAPAGEPPTAISSSAAGAATTPSQRDP